MTIDLPPRVRARLDPAERFGLRLTLIGLAIVVVAIPFSALTFEVLARDAIPRFDGRIADRLNDWASGSPSLVSAMNAISMLGRAPVLAVWVVLAVTWAWWVGRRRIAVFLAVTSLGVGIVDSLVKVAVNRPRPVVDHPVATAFGKSFPSGHAMSATVIYGALLIALAPLLAPAMRRIATAGVAVLILAVGCSRLVLGVHFVSDVVGGYLLGIAWLAGATAAFEAWRHDIRARSWRRRRIGVHAKAEVESEVEALLH